MTTDEIIEEINERIEANKDDLKEMKANEISMNSCGAGFAQGAIEELQSLKKFILGDE